MYGQNLHCQPHRADHAGNTGSILVSEFRTRFQIQACRFQQQDLKKEVDSCHPSTPQVVRQTIDPFEQKSD